MSDTFEVTVAEVEDAAMISHLYKRVWDEYTGQFPDELRISRQPNPEEMEQWIRDNTYFIVKIDSEVVGVVGCRMEHGACLMAHMVVDRDYRERGIGSDLVSRSIRFARENNATKVWLDTVPFLREAVSLYTGFGFGKCGHLKKHFWGLDVELYELML